MKNTLAALFRGVSSASLGVSMACILMSGLTFASQSKPAHVWNGRFEMGLPGQEPRGWSLLPSYKEAGYTVKLSARYRHSGSQGMELASGVVEWSTGEVSQSVSAAPFRGKHFVLTAWMRTRGDGTGSVEMEASVTQANGKTGAFISERDRAVTQGQWTKRTIEGTFLQGADRLSVTFRWNGTGSCWVDDVDLRVSDEG